MVQQVQFLIFGKDLPSDIESDIILRARQALPDQHKQGFLTFGPYLDLPLGKYVIELFYKSSDSENTRVGFWDITAGKG